MASTTESLETSANSLPSFSFPTQFMSFSSLLYDSDPANASPENRNSPARISVTRGFSDRTSGIPKFKSFPPPSLPLSPPPFSPSSYLSIPPGLSPADLLDSPVLLSTSNILASPTTGTFPSQVFNWRSSSAAASGGNGNYQQTIKVEQKGSSDFSFQPETKQVPGSIFQSSSATISTEEALKRQQQRQPWNYLEPNKPAEFSASTYGGAVGKTNIKAEFVAPIHSVSPEITTNETGFQSNFSHNSQPSQTLREQRKSEDGFNWRKYGQKQVKGSENPRSYYKCTYPNCPMKKKVERSFEGQITEIVYKGTHNHAKPQSTRRTAAAQATQANREAIKVEGGSSWAKLPLKVNSESLEISSPASVVTEISDPSLMGQSSPAQMESIGTPDNSSISVGEEEFDQSSQRSRSGGEELDDTEPDAKRWRKESENEGISASGSRTMREPRVVVQTTSDIDILDDGYRWRKYGQKVVKGNPNPRSYYKCTHLGCLVRKHVERASHDLRAVITTYEGKHNHDVPAARGSASHALANKLAPDNNFSNAIRSSAMAKFSNHMTCNSSFGGTPPVSREGQAPFTLEMVQSPTSYEQTGFENFSGPYMGPMKGMETRFTKAKDEPRDELFFDSLLC